MAADRFIPVSAPDLSGREEEYVLDCLRSTWISSAGAYIERFEQRFAELCGCAHAVACNSGTSALHLALAAAGIGPGDEVVVPALTFVASANAVRYCGAEPRFADCRPDTWNLDPDDVARRIGPRTRAIMAVHLFGEPVELDALAALCERHDLTLVEDAAEAHGARYGGRPVGALGRAGAFSFYGNKVVTTGEGGALVTDDPELARTARLYRGQGQDPERRYWFTVVGFNYRMTNVQAAIGLAQLENVEDKLVARERVAARYGELLAELPGVRTQALSSGSRSAHWMVGVTLPVGGAAERDRVAELMLADGIETRPFFYPLHTLPPYAGGGHGELAVAEDVAARGLCLPTWGGLSDEDVERVCETLARSLARVAAPVG